MAILLIKYLPLWDETYYYYNKLNILIEYKRFSQSC